MKNINPSPADGKRFALFCFLGVLIFCTSIVSAQSGNHRQISAGKEYAETEKAVVADAEQNQVAARSQNLTNLNAENSSAAFSTASARRAGHGIIDVVAAETTGKITADVSTPQKIESRREKFFAAENANQSFAGQMGADFIKSDNKDSHWQLLSTGAVKSDDGKKDFLDDPLSLDSQDGTSEQGFRWRPAIQQALLFLAVQHGYAMTQPKTREALKGRFFHDYIESVKSLHGWDDGGRFFTNYLAHPMQGSFVGFIQIQNDPKGMKQRFGTSGDYWRSRMKAMAWSAAWSTQFEIGPISQASIGNVGLKGKQTWEDIIVTPTVGTAMLISEDALDRFVIERIERSTNNFYLTIFSRMLLNPTRTVANLIRFKHPWYRDRARAR